MEELPEMEPRLWERQLHSFTPNQPKRAFQYAEHPLYEVRLLLQKIVDENNWQLLMEALSGKHVPLYGGNQEPAEVLVQALEEAFEDPRDLEQLARVTTRTCYTYKGNLEYALSISMKLGAQKSHVPSTSWKTAFSNAEPEIYNLFYLAAHLPAEEDLFAALKQFNSNPDIKKILSSGSARATRQLINALIYQQTDGTLGEDWLGKIKATHSEKGLPLNEEQQEEILRAWLGLLWVPGDKEQDADIPLSLIENGLKALDEALPDPYQNAALLSYAVQQINWSYPSSPDYWKEKFSEKLQNYSENLQAAIQGLWASEETDEEQTPEWVPESSQTAWSALTQSTKNELIEKSPDERKLLLQKLLLDKQHPELTPQEWNKQIGAILSKCSPQKKVDETHAQAEEQTGEEFQEIQSPKIRRRGIDRKKALARVGTVLEQIRGYLRKRDLRTSQKYLDDLIAHQENESATKDLIAKTLSNVAASALEFGFAQWAQELYPQAIDKNPNDAVARCGLADTLKARDRLEEAEQLYRETVRDFPNNAVARNGLADTLKARDRLEEAEQLYRETVDRFPNNAVARCGLADTLKARDRLEEAEQLYRETVRDFPNDAVAKHGLANLLRMRRSFKEALEWVHEPGSVVGKRNRYDLHLLGMIHLEQGNVPESVRLFEKGMSGNFPPKDRRIFQSALATALLKSGDYPKAREQLRPLVENVLTLETNIKILYLHAVAGCGDPDPSREYYSDLQKRTDLFNRYQKASLEALEKGFAFHENEQGFTLSPISDNDNDLAVNAEIEMLLAV